MDGYRNLYKSIISIRCQIPDEGREGWRKEVWREDGDGGRWVQVN